MHFNCKFPVVTLYGSNYINNEWTIPCMESWKHIRNISAENFFILPDKVLSKEEETTLKNMKFNILSEEQEASVQLFLKDYPGLTEIRKKDVTWKKLLDVGILFRKSEKITIIDTDVYINSSITLPLDDCDLAYMREDIPAYRAKWFIVWKEKMVPALNAGIIIVNPEILNFDYLEKLTTKYLINCNEYWWTEQSAWACLAGKVHKRLLLSGKQVRVTSGTYKRNSLEINNNSYKYFGRKGMMKEYSEFEPTLDGGIIFHFAGPGKYMFKKSLPYLDAHKENEVVHITGEVEQTLSFRDKVMISSRLFLKETFKK